MDYGDCSPIRFRHVHADNKCYPQPFQYTLYCVMAHHPTKQQAQHSAVAALWAESELSRQQLYLKVPCECQWPSSYKEPVHVLCVPAAGQTRQSFSEQEALQPKQQLCWWVRRLSYLIACSAATAVTPYASCNCVHQSLSEFLLKGGHTGYCSSSLNDTKLLKRTTSWRQVVTI